MSKTNVEVVREFIDQVTNNQRYDLAYHYCSEKCVLHGTPFSGLGIAPIPSPGEKVIIQYINPNGPAVGQLLVGDEVVRVQDASQTWETFNDIVNNPWGPGKLGDPVTLTVRRNGELMEVPLVRSRVMNDITVAEWLEWWKDSVIKEWPDLKEEVNLILGQDDLVAYYGIIHGTNTKFHTTAVWAECSIYRLADGKIVEMWGVSDDLTLNKQLGYQVLAPALNAS